MWVIVFDFICKGFIIVVYVEKVRYEVVIGNVDIKEVVFIKVRNSKF